MALNSLRALAVLLVMGHHVAWRFRPDASDPVGRIFQYSGWIGVDIFFVISGFMITRILIRDRDDIAGFFRRRVFRILPIYFIAVCVFMLSSLIFGDSGDLHRIWSPLLLLNGWTIPIFGQENLPFTITWSLSVEETAYVILGLACLGGVDRMKLALFGFLALAPIVRLISVWTSVIDLTDLYFFVPARLDSIALGGLAALGAFVRVTKFRFFSVVAGAAVLGLIILFQYISLDNPIMPIVGYFVFATTVACFVTVLSDNSASGLQTNWYAEHFPLRYAAVWSAKFGTLSYFVYLFHIFIIEGVGIVLNFIGYHDAGFWTVFLISIVSIFFMAAASWKYFEYPLIQRGRRVAQRDAMVPPSPRRSG